MAWTGLTGTWWLMFANTLISPPTPVCGLGGIYGVYSQPAQRGIHVKGSVSQDFQQKACSFSTVKMGEDILTNVQIYLRGKANNNAEENFSFIFTTAPRQNLPWPRWILKDIYELRWGNYQKQTHLYSVLDRHRHYHKTRNQVCPFVLVLLNTYIKTIKIHSRKLFV